MEEATIALLSFRYQIVAGEPTPLPICDVMLLGPAARVPVRALIDSGATHSVFPTKAAEDAGIMLRTGLPFRIQYGGSTAVGLRARVYIELGQVRHRTEVVFVERLAYPYALLGRGCLFSHFNEVAFLEKIATPRVEFRT